MSTYDGLCVARAALREAGYRGLPQRVLVDIVTHVGGVSRGTAYMALRARIAWSGQYTAESSERWPGITVSGHRLDEQVWIMRPIERAEAG